MEERNMSSWNYKRIFIALFLLAGVIAAGYYVNMYLLGNKINLSHKEQRPSSASHESVKGATSEERVSIQEALKEKIEELKKEASKIDVSEIASSSSQIQKLIKDLNSIKEYPVNQAKEICEKVCGNL